MFAFGQILGFSQIGGSLVLEATNKLKIYLETDLNLEWILIRFGDHKVTEIGFQIHSKASMETTLFLGPFLGSLGGA